MSELAEFTADGKLTVPADVANRFHPEDRFLVWADGDTVHFKRVTPPKVTEIVAQGSADEPMGADEIAEEIREYRRSKRAR